MWDMAPALPEDAPLDSIPIHNIGRRFFECSKCGKKYGLISLLKEEKR
jgi:hypothetical protein